MWLTRLLRRKALENDLTRELQFHVDAATADHIRAGLSPAEANRRARIELGGPEQVREATRDARGTRLVEDAIADVRFALRGMRRSPAFAIAAVSTIAIGVGANTAVWSIMDALMNRALPIEKPSTLYAMKRTSDDGPNYLISYPLMQRIRAAMPDTASVAGMSSIGRAYLTVTDQPEGVLVQAVSGNFFSVLGVRAAAGRVITPEDDRVLGASQVVVITDAFWERRFGRDPSVVGRRVRFNGFPVTIVGVLAPGFSGLTVGNPVDVFAPTAMQHELRIRGNASSSNADNEKPWVPQRGISWLTLVTRVPAATGVAAIQNRIAAPFHADLVEEFADRDSTSRAFGMRERVELEPIARGFSDLRTDFRDPLRALLVGVGLVLLITCANLTGLVLARSEARSQEIAVRASLGAVSSRLVRQVATESITLAVMGGALGLVVAHFAVKALLVLASSGTRAIPLDASLDGRVLLFAFGVTLFAGIVVGLAPAMRVSQFDLYAAFKTGGRVQGGSHRLPLGRMLVMAQIAIALILVTSAGVFMRTFQNMLDIRAGYDRETAMTARIDVRAAGYAPEALPGLYERLVTAAAAVPGVKSAALSVSGLSLGQRRVSGYRVPGRELPPSERGGQENWITPDYLRTVGIPLLQGRAFTAGDTKDRPNVAVVSVAFAKHFFGTTDVIGARFGYDTADTEVIGVAGDVLANGLKEKAPPMIYRPLAQGPQEYAGTVDVRFTGRREPVIAALRNAIARVDHNLPVREIATIGSIAERGLSRERMVARLAQGFGALALLLAAIGLYGVISYSVARRTNEMGVRLALGASPGGVSWIVMRDSLATVGAGLAAGVALWFPVLGLTRRLVYGVSPHDPVLLGGGLAVLLAVGAMAGLIPAWRASRIDPIDAIRAD